MSGTTIGIRRAADALSRLERVILLRVDRAVRIGEGELRYQLESKDGHPLARDPGLLDVLGELEARGLIDSELVVRLTARGRERLAELAAVGEG